MEKNYASIFDVASKGSEALQNLNAGFIIAASAMLLLVIFLTLFISIKFRKRENTPEPAQDIEGGHIEWLMVGIPLLMVTVFFLWSMKTMGIVMPPRGNHVPDIIITGHQWWWEASYTGTKIVTANEIHLPAGKPFLIQLHSADVIHDWWVPAFGAKMDMIPGMDNFLWVSILRPGKYEGACSEFCGQQHAWMRIQVIAEDSISYQQWLAKQSLNADSTAVAEKTGAVIFANASCSSCHNIRGTNAAGSQGPDLTHFGSRKTMLAGMLPNSSENLIRWLSDPQLVKPGAKMPRFIFGKDSIQALTSFLEKLK